jgi:mannose-1-phosphate guanylyltransferase
VRAVILVGGFGTRLRPLTLETPKQMLPIVDRPMIERVVAHLGEHGVTDAILSLGYRPDAFIDAYPDDRCAGVHLHYAVEAEPLDTAGAVRFAADEGGIDAPFVVVNGDVLTDLDLRGLWKLHHERRAEATIALTPVDDPSRYGVVPTDDDGRVLAFIEKPPADEAPCNWINAGTYVLDPSVLERIPLGRPSSIERETFPALVDDGTLYAVASDAYWIDAGTPATYLQAQLDLIDGARGEPEPALAPTATIIPGAVVDHAILMDGVVVEATAEVRDAVLLPGARVGAGAQVRGSIVGPGASVGEGARLDDLCVIGSGAVVPADAELHGGRLPDPEATREPRGRPVNPEAGP